MARDGLPVVGFDWDGTLFHSNAVSSDYDDPVRLEKVTWPHYGALWLVGHEPLVPVVITGRTARVRALTVKQAKRYLGPRVPVITQETWQGIDALVAFKADAIREAGCHAYVGDSLQDHEAAGLAGVPFLHVERFVKHGLDPLYPYLEV